jgi:hypothetical protein
MLFAALGEESIDAYMELLDEPYPISELEEKVPQEECADPSLVASTPTNLESACGAIILGLSFPFAPIGGKFSQSHNTEPFWLQSIPNEPIPEPRISAVLLAVSQSSYL